MLFHGDLSLKMISLSIVGLGLGVTFGCLLILVVAEICYFLCWKKRNTSHNTDSEKDTNNNITGKHLFQMFSEEKSGFNTNGVGDGDSDDPEEEEEEEEEEEHEDDEEEEESYCHHSPRFLFTIEEGTKEGSECESMNNNKSSCKVSPCDSFTVETPYFTPLASVSSPCLASPVITLPLSSNPANDNSVEFHRVKSSSTPPSRFKLLQQIQEKSS